MESQDEAEICLIETDDFEAIRGLALESGLEDGAFEDIVIAFGCYSANRLIGCAALKSLGEAFSVEWLAVDESRRKEGIGRKVVERVAAEAKSRGATQLWALARAPDFFLRVGFMLSSPEESPGPTLSGCIKCPQYQTTCHPKIVVKDL
jgi:argininosuccinate lyase/amino-acid N-acetyltransferase